MSHAPNSYRAAFPKDWPEDFDHENGNYWCNCYKCDQFFFGHKRRVICKECATRSDATDSRDQKEKS